MSEKPMTASNQEFTLLGIISDIRKKSGMGDKPMLSELADAIAWKIDQYPRIIDLVRRDELKRQQFEIDRIESLNEWEIPPLHEISEASTAANRHTHALSVIRSIESGVAIESVPLSSLKEPTP